MENPGLSGDSFTDVAEGFVFFSGKFTDVDELDGGLEGVW